MIVTAALAWFDEPLDQLDECVRALPVVADRLVAVDGGYSRYPGAKPSSPKNQADQIRATCREVGIDCVIHTPTRIWAGQVQKRSHLLQLAADGSDWFLPIDADHILDGDRDDVRAELGSADVDVFSVDYFTPMNCDRPLEESAAVEWHRQIAGRTQEIPHFFRSLPCVRVERFHWWYSAVKDGERVWLYGGDRGPRAAERKLRADYRVEHRCLFREPKQILRNRDFCEDRVTIVRETGQEDDLAALEELVA